MTSSVGSHLGIELGEYDVRIRTFIPDYETMLDEAARAVQIFTPRARIVVDLGIGTGALAARCLALVKSARVIGVDVDEGILEMARGRLGTRVSVRATDFLSAPLPRCDAVIASFALHHVRTRRAKAALYARCHAALRRGGVLVSADCFLASTPRLRAVDRRAWRAHLERHYRRRKAEAYLRAWGRDDVYLPLDEEVDLMRAAGFTVDVPWRRHGFAVVTGSRP
jgi:SAM-dependent methyltransferase